MTLRFIGHLKEENKRQSLAECYLIEPVHLKNTITKTVVNLQNSSAIDFFRLFFLIPKSETNFLVETVHPSIYSRPKRFLDICGAIFGLGITTILLIPLAIAISLDSPGPIFYSQVRCGLHGKHFKIWKFRSMIVNADRQQHLIKNQAQGYIFKNKNDPRITKIGKFIRKTSLDEFPQFWNVLKGEMSLVGTRPPTLEEVQKYEDHHLRRLQVKPGITGEWQVQGRSKVKTFDEIVQMDLDYQYKWSIIYDLYLILKTILVVLSCKGAY